MAGEVRQNEPFVWYRDSGQIWECSYSVFPWLYGNQRGIIVECRSIRVNGIERIVNAMGGGNIPWRNAADHGLTASLHHSMMLDAMPKGARPLRITYAAS
jgi:hypothetical protein